MIRKIVAASLLCIAGFTAWLAYIGYFGGGLFTDVAGEGRRSSVAAVVLSGDMGFRIGMSPRIAERLAADGVSVVGVNSLSYFRVRRSPEQVEQLIARAVERAAMLGHTDQIILVGQSFGADMVHIGLAKAPPSLRAKVKMVALIVPTDTVFFRASPSELFNWSKADARALPTARLLDWVPVACIQGRAERESLCPQLVQHNVARIALPGGHPLNNDADALYAALKVQIARAVPDAFRTTATSPEGTPR